MNTKSTHQTAATGQPRAKKRSTRNYGNFTSKPEVKRLDECSDQELIAEGSRQPFAKHYSFQKTAKERKQLKRVKSSAKGKTGGIPHTTITTPPALLIVHLENRKKDKMFKTTHSFTVKSNEVSQVLNTFFYLNDQDNPLRQKVTKCFYNGKPFKVTQ